MGLQLDQLLLYGGGVVAGTAALAAIVSFFIMRLKKERLSRALDKEYGEE